MSKGLIMEGSTSNITAEIIFESQDEEEEPDEAKRPILLLLQRLVSDSQNTMMTNAQIIEILETEYNICIKSCHELEVDIYINIIKRFLKEWPQWDHFERKIRKLNKVKDFEAVTKFLKVKHSNLKEYLGVMLEAAKPMIKDAVDSVTPKNVETDDPKDVVMEIHCTKEQLNQLFFRRPRTDLNNTIFNMSNVPPSSISLKSLTFKQILYGWCVKLDISLPHFCFVREVTYKLKHVLVNKVLNASKPEVCLNTSLQVLRREQASKMNKSFDTDMIVKRFGCILKACASQSHELYETVHSLFEILIPELKDVFGKKTQYKVPANYRRCANRYKYVRYFYTENDQSNDQRYDLQLEETATPMYNYYFGKLDKIGKLPPITEWLKFECMLCQVKLPVSLPCVKVALESHFNEVHQNEKDWQCTHCKRSFSIDYLSNNKWYHEC